MKLNHCFLGDCRDSMRQMLAEDYAGRIQCIVTSPPYWGLRDYGLPESHWPEVTFSPVAGLPPITVPEWTGCLGLEPDPWMFVGHIVEVFRLGRDLLADDGTLWMNFGDSYATGAGKVNSAPGGGTQSERWTGIRGDDKSPARGPMTQPNRMPIPGLKPKDLCGIPWRVAFALQADGWWLRQDNIWNKPNPMPESVRDRCTKSHEYVFLLAKSERYYFDQKAILEPVSAGTHARLSQNVQDQIGSGRANGGSRSDRPMKAVVPTGWATGTDRKHDEKVGRYSQHRKVYPGTGVGFGHGYDKTVKPRVKNNESFDAAIAIMPDTRNKRSVWTIPTESYSEAHFATFPRALVEPCILAGSRPGDIVFDLFIGSGTTAEVAQNLGRPWVGCEMNPTNLDLQNNRTRQGGLVLEVA